MISITIVPNFDLYVDHMFSINHPSGYPMLTYNQNILKYKLDQYVTLWLANTSNELSALLNMKLRTICRCAKPPMDSITIDILLWIGDASGHHTDQEHPRTIWHTPLLARTEAHTGSISSPICCTDLFTKDSFLGFPKSFAHEIPVAGSTWGQWTPKTRR